MSRSACAAILVVSALAACGCHFGTRTQTFGPARGPGGVAAEIVTPAGSWVSGELLEVQDTALLVLSDQRIVLVPYSLVRSAQFDQMNRNTMILGQVTPSVAVREELRLVSRFPQGVTPGLLEELLAAYGQSEVIRVVR